MICVCTSPEDTTTAEHQDHVLDASDQLLCLVDQDGRLSDIGAGAAELLGWDAAHRGRPLQDTVHPEDAPRLLLALGHSWADRRSAVIDLRIRGRTGDWDAVRCQVSPLGDNDPPRYAMAIRLSELDEGSATERASRLEGHLWRIALEVQAARIADRSSLREAWWTDPATRRAGGGDRHHRPGAGDHREHGAQSPLRHLRKVWGALPGRADVPTDAPERVIQEHGHRQMPRESNPQSIATGHSRADSGVWTGDTGHSPVLVRLDPSPLWRSRRLGNSRYDGFSTVGG